MSADGQAVSTESWELQVAVRAADLAPSFGEARPTVPD